MFEKYKENNHCGRNKLLCEFCKIKSGDCIQVNSREKHNQTGISVIKRIVFLLSMLLALQRMV